MPIHKLATGPITMTVAKCEQREGNFGPQWLFSSEDGMDVYVTEMAGAKGLARLNLTPETVVGKTLTLVQVKKDGKTFTNIELSTGSFLDDEPDPVAKVNTKAAPAPAAVAAPAAPKMDLSAIASLYSQCVEKAIATLGVQCEGAGIPYDASAIQAAAATMFIRMTK